MVGGDPSFEEQEDGSHALVVPEGAYLKVSLPHVSPWSLEDDGRLHRYSLLLALRLDRLPLSGTPLFNGGGLPAQGEALEHVQIYKNGGVGALGRLGTQEAAVRAERWAWIAVTRNDGELRTYVNGRFCAEVKLETKLPKRKPNSRDDEKEEGGKESGKESGKSQAERFCIDPQHLALFCAREGGEEDNSAEAGERGLALKYVKLVTTCWSEEQLRDEIVALRGRDEEADLAEEADKERFEQLSLQVREAIVVANSPYARQHLLSPPVGALRETTADLAPSRLRGRNGERLHQRHGPHGRLLTHFARGSRTRAAAHACRGRLRSPAAAC